MNKKILTNVIMFLMVIPVLSCGRALIDTNNDAFVKAVLAINSDEVYLDDLTTFDWDTMYYFPPYYPKEAIEEMLGLQSPHIKATVSEGMNQLIFIRDKAIDCYIYGYGTNHGFLFHFEPVAGGGVFALDRGAGARFSVVDSDGIMILTYLFENVD